MRRLKNVAIILMLTIFMLGIVSQLNVVKADGTKYLGIKKLRQSGYAYKQSDKVVWKITEYGENTNNSTEVTPQPGLIYCIKAGAGFGDPNNDNGNAKKTYIEIGNLKSDTFVSPYLEVLPTGESYSKLLWVLDNIYTGIGENNETKRNAYLANVYSEIGQENGTLAYGDYLLLNDDDIDVVQQLAIWHFTNPGSEFDYYNELTNEDEIGLRISSIVNDENSPITAELEDYRLTAAKTLYRYLIESAVGNYNPPAPTGEEPITITSTNATMYKEDGNYIAGPFVINEKQGFAGVDYTITATYKDDQNNTITPEIGVKGSNNKVAATTSTLKELEGTEFYLIMPDTSNIEGMKMQISTSFSNRDVIYWSVENPENEQPVVIIKDNNVPHDYDEIVVTLQKEFDLALRKFITAINGVPVTVSRQPQVDVTPLVDKTDTTAIYNHTKQPLKIEVGDIITYTIRIYNEGEIDGYAEEITDHLPPNLEFLPDNTTNQTYGWQLKSATDLKTLTTAYLSENNEITAGENKITAFDGGTTLSSKDVQIVCKVVEVEQTDPITNEVTAFIQDKITNIAEITNFTDGEGNAIEDRDSGVADSGDKKKATIPEDANLPTYMDDAINRGDTYIPGQEDDDDFEKVMLKEFDLALRKYITAVKSGDTTTEITDREPEPDTSKLNTMGPDNKLITTAEYNHTKVPVPVAIGDIVVYTIRVYNEGEIDGYAQEITDHLPANLKLVTASDDATYGAFNEAFGWQADSTDPQIIRTSYLANQKVVAFNGTNGEYLKTNSKAVQVACKVIATDPMPEKITNIAEITEYTAVNKQDEVIHIEDRDNEAEVVMPQDLPGYNDDKTGPYIPGQEDDDDFEKLIIKEFDLALRKFITKVGNIEVDREPTIDATQLASREKTTAEYKHKKSPEPVTIGTKVEYTIRVYNEGDIDGYASEITDHLPAQLKFLPDDDTNKAYGWEQDQSNPQIIKTDYLSKAKETESRTNKIVAFNGTNLETAAKEIKVVCEVVETDPMAKKITNIAEITKFTDGAGNSIEDRDSGVADSGNKKKATIPEGEALEEYKGNSENKADLTDKTYHYKGQEDDDDFEKLVIKEFDLALRKFITKVNNTDITSRYPVVSKASDGKLVYTHTKEPVLVANSNIVTYTIRVYNEGEVNGYANLIKDDIPEGLEFLPEHETNKEYRWVMLDEDGNETDDVSEAVTIQTDYASKENGEEMMKDDSSLTENPNLLKAFNADIDLSDTNPSNVDVKVAFKVVESNKSDRIIINEAQISDDSDEYGRPVIDIDSEPDEWIDGEDDQDIEKIRVQYFDLALRKWVTQAIVIENGKETITQTGHKAEDDPEDIVLVSIKKKKINSITVKFKYSIRVTNEGEIAGYVKEITDYIPDGLKFVAEDNPTWTVKSEGIITTDQAKDILLEPGESTEVEVLLTWINDAENMGKKVNVAEISKDYNEYEAPDIDSVPDNKKDGEDDIDDAPVMLQPATGQIRLYAEVAGAVLVILVAGIVLIKKFVI